MTIKTNTAEGLTGAADGLAVTGSLTAGGGDQIQIAGTSARWTLKTGSMHGTYCYRCARNSGGSGENPVMLYSLATNQGNISVYFKLSALPTVAMAILVASGSGGFVAFAYVMPNGSVRIDSAGSVSVSTLAAGLEINTWYRLDLGVAVGTTTGNGTIRASVALRDRTTPIASFASSTVNTGTTALTNVQWGAPVASTTTALSIDFDDPRLDDSTATLAGAHNYVAAGSGRFDWRLANPGGFTASGDFVTDLQDGNDSTGVTSPGVTVNETLEYSIPPMAVGAFTGSFKAAWVDGANSMRLTLRQGSTPTTPGTQISTRLFSLTNTQATYSYSNTAPENAAITDWADLSMQIIFNAT